ncbi:uncharacterized protein GGS25DRAFT_479561 [Hypoxylon fragiforme]|uniref:uncharacterized protein n=1 Tax=Hypoxylon fragiforme TaxID=63214 RepID=UPI0020C653DC|nr:uncharacterized protein GGS25DRAFT_479561 [Hypoxylon fragiforme]KAI2610729.1 hypothetical protein GGS25DRAFT_479561 [Hypoxylon fragiforme]
MAFAITIENLLRNLGNINQSLALFRSLFNMLPTFSPTRPTDSQAVALLPAVNSLESNNEGEPIQTQSDTSMGTGNTKNEPGRTAHKEPKRVAVLQKSRNSRHVTVHCEGLLMGHSNNQITVIHGGGIALLEGALLCLATASITAAVFYLITRT